MKNIRFIFGVIIGIALFSSPASFALVHADTSTSTPPAATSTDSSATSTDATSTPPSTEGTGTSTPAAETAHIGIRVGNTLVGPFSVTLPAADATTSLAATGTTTAHDISGRSILALLAGADATNADFELSTLQYYDSFSSFYLKCVTIPSSTPLCDNWRYSLNGSFPSTGADVKTLANNDIAYFFFGSPRQVVVSTTTVTVGTSFNATAQVYDPAAGTYAFTTGVTLGATQPDPSNPWSPLVVASSTVDASGQTIFTLNATGTYNIGIAEDGYFPNTPITVVEAPATTTPTTTPPTTGGGSGGGGFSHSNLDSTRALSFLNSHQNADGSFNGSILTDWAAIAYASAGVSAEKTKLHDYLVSASPVLSGVTDYERHAMALEALGINPYSGAGKDYITPIVNAFDGTQVGSSSLINDDIFALFALTHAGYSQSDDIIKKIAVNLIAQQHADGSWDGGPEMTAAAAQALGPLYMVPGNNASLTKAIGYLNGAISPTGGWNNSDETSWVITAINSMNEVTDPRSPHYPLDTSWTASNGYFPTDVLARAQQSDGSVVSTDSTTDGRIWSTGYALVAASTKSWTSLLKEFAKPTTSALGGGYGGGSSYVASDATSTATSTDSLLDTATSTEATSTVATSTPPMASSTPELLAPTTTPPVATSSTQAVVTQPKKKTTKPALKVTAPKTTDSTQSTTSKAQTAAAANVVNRGFLGSIWHFITGLFTGR